MLNLKDHNTTKSALLLKIIKDLSDLATNPNRQEKTIQRREQDDTDINEAISCHQTITKKILSLGSRNKEKDKQETLQGKIIQIINLGITENDNNWREIMKQKLRRFNLSGSRMITDALTKIKQHSHFHRNCLEIHRIQLGASLIQEIKQSQAKSAIFQRFIDSFLLGSEKTQKVIQNINQRIIEAEFKDKLKTTQRICQIVQKLYSIIKGNALIKKKISLVEKLQALLDYHNISHRQKMKKEQEKTQGRIGAQASTKILEEDIKRLLQLNRKLEQELRVNEINKKPAQEFNFSLQNEFINLEQKSKHFIKFIGSILKQQFQCDQSIINKDQDQLLGFLKQKVMNLKQERQMIYSQNISLMKEGQKIETQLQGKIRQNSYKMKKQTEINDYNERLKGLLANTEIQNKIQIEEITKLKADLEAQRSYSKNPKISHQSNLQMELRERLHDAQRQLQQQTKKALKYSQELRQMTQRQHRLQQITKRKQAECCDHTVRLSQSDQKINMQKVHKGLLDEDNKLKQKLSILTKNEEIHNQRLEAITKEFTELTQSYHEQQVRCKMYQSQIKTLTCTIEDSTLRQNEFALLRLENVNIKQSLTHLQEQYKLLENSHEFLQKKEKKAVDDYEGLLYQCKGKNTQIENLKMTLGNQRQLNSKELLKMKALQDKIVKLERQSSDLQSQITTLTREDTVLRQQLRQRQKDISKLQAKIKETTNNLSNGAKGHNNSYSSYHKTQLEMSIELAKEIQMKVQSELSRFKRFFCSQSKKQYRQLMQRNDIQKSNYACMLYIDRFFQGEMLQEKIQYKLRLLAHIYRLTGVVVAKTHLIYRMDLKNKTNFHEYIDKTSSLMLLVKTNTGAYVAGYYTGEYGAHPMTEPAILISITNNQSYNLNVPQNGSKSSYRAMVYDPYFLIFGNAELRIKTGEKTVFSNFGIMNSYYNSRGKKVQDLLCEEGTRETGIQSYEIYQIFFDYDYVEEEDDYHKY